MKRLEVMQSFPLIFYRNSINLSALLHSKYKQWFQKKLYVSMHQYNFHAWGLHL